MVCPLLLVAQSFTLGYQTALVNGTITAPEINEASGLAASYTEVGAFWTHNDSGDGPNLYLVGPNGNLLTQGAIVGATAPDWEDMASFEKEGTSYLVVGDFGDNFQLRNTYSLYLIEEPTYDPDSPSGNSYPIYKRIDYVYDNGRQDGESIGVDVENDQIILVSKTRNNGNFTVYELPLNLNGTNETLVASTIASFTVEGASTAMDIAGDGQHAIVLTYGDAFQFTRYYGSNWAETFTGEPSRITMPQRGGGEAIAYGASGSDLYSVREGNDSPLWHLVAIQDTGTIFRVDLFEIDAEDYDRVYVNIVGQAEAIELTDTDEDGIYAGQVDLPTDETYQYFFSYSNGPSPAVNEVIQGACSAGGALREVVVDRPYIQLPPVLFGQCSELPYYLTVKTDLGNITDRTDGGKVWVELIDTGEEYELADQSDTIYAYRVALPRGETIRYRFSYQSGPDPDTDRTYEVVPPACNAGEDTRGYTANVEQVVLLADEFNTCDEALPGGIDITDLDGTTIVGSNDDFPWLGPEVGSGSPLGQEVTRLIDGEIGTKYLVRAISSWAEISSPNYSVVNAYTITSGGDVPTRDPRAWMLQAYNDLTGQWDTLHTVIDNPSWPERDQRQSWYFDNEESYVVYRLFITGINGNTQQLMQMAELDIFGTAGRPVSATPGLAGNLRVTIHPNPVTDVLVLEAQNLTAARYELFTPTGARVGSGQTAFPGRIDVSGLPTGVYFLRLTDGNDKGVFRIVKR